MALVLRNTKENSSDIFAVERINTEAFPPNERMSTQRLFDIGGKDCFELLTAFDGKPVGFMLAAFYGESVYLFLLAVDKGMRSKGYGGKMLSLLAERYPEKQIVLDIEEPDENAENSAQRQKRKSFYLKNGYTETGFFMDYCETRFEVLCSSEKFDKNDFERLLERINREGFELSIFEK